MPRSCRRSSTLRSESGNRTYNITAKRMISGLVLKYLNGEYFVIRKRYKASLHSSSSFCLTVPDGELPLRSVANYIKSRAIRVRKDSDRIVRSARTKCVFWEKRLKRVIPFYLTRTNSPLKHGRCITAGAGPCNEVVWTDQDHWAFIFVRRIL
jgi:hypothetical protein